MPVSVGRAARTAALRSRPSRIVLLLTALAVLAALPSLASAASMRWSPAVRVEPSKNGGVDAVSCPTARFCVAVDASGYVATTTNPTGRVRVWSKLAKIDSTTLTGISCPTTKLCVAVDDSGNVLASTNPTGGSRAWSRAHVDPTSGSDGGPAGLTGISCPTTTLCVAVDAATGGNALTSTNPAGGARAWKLTTIGGGPLNGVSCASSALCVAAGTQHVYSTSPTGGSAAWHATGPQAGGGVFSAVDCLYTTLCVAVGYGNTSTGLVTSTRNPKGGASAWRTVGVQNTPPDPGESLLDAVGCTRGFCVAVDGADNAYTSSAPVSGTWSSAAAIRPKSISQASAISCTSGICVVVDSAGVSTTGILH